MHRYETDSLIEELGYASVKPEALEHEYLRASCSFDRSYWGFSDQQLDTRCCISILQHLPIQGIETFFHPVIMKTVLLIISAVVGRMIAIKLEIRVLETQMIPYTAWSHEDIRLSLCPESFA